MLSTPTSLHTNACIYACSKYLYPSAYDQRSHSTCPCSDLHQYSNSCAHSYTNTESHPDPYRHISSYALSHTECHAHA